MNALTSFISEQLKEQQLDLAAAIAQPSWQKAAAFAAQAHAGETGAHEVPSSFAHATRVAVMVSALCRCQDETVLATALLHNVLEKTNVSFEELEREFGRLIASRVERLSRDPTQDEAVHIKRLHACDWQTRLVMLADAADHLENEDQDLVERIHKTISVLDLAFGREQPLLRAHRHLVELLENLGAISSTQPDYEATSSGLYAGNHPHRGHLLRPPFTATFSTASWMREG